MTAIMELEARSSTAQSSHYSMNYSLPSRFHLGLTNQAVTKTPSDEYSCLRRYFMSTVQVPRSKPGSSIPMTRDTSVSIVAWRGTDVGCISLSYPSLCHRGYLVEAPSLAKVKI